MRILVCVDGSEQSKRALEETVYIAGGYNVEEVSVIHVLNYRPESHGEVAFPANEQLEYYNQLKHKAKSDSQHILSEAVKLLESKKLKVNPIFKEGHPATIINKLAEAEGYDIIILGSKGLSGLKKVLFGSVSNAVLQGAQCNVYIVK
ncbi:universal stress protein [Dethiobacter alkaliphilus]|uniref:universal stress protein n=1 Tax=Dethiobacter alkaliphilus TaxID=427926 RepID=UPI0022262118|nr:universal stress protein [Dethiobacter alkaliphilus]MCW3488573.1 universal stress protein [Dethiobacter alkaliphilus]